MKIPGSRLAEDNFFSAYTTFMEYETCKLYTIESFEYFCQMSSKLVFYNFELYGYKVGAFSLRHSVYCV